jgi:serine/threonine protein phosphatase 1
LYYLIGDIHGYYKRLVNLMDRLTVRVSEDDTIIFLGDYIDRGAYSYEVIDFLISCAMTGGLNTVFLKGNHEDMLIGYLLGDERGGPYLLNGGEATIRSYIAHRGKMELPERHREFLKGLRLYYETDEFIAVHAGLNPAFTGLEAQSEHDMLWIREKFFRAEKRWDKTIIFGHTPMQYFSRTDGIYRDPERNIIGIDGGVIFGNPLVCLVWPTMEIITG